MKDLKTKRQAKRYLNKIIKEHNKSVLLQKKYKDVSISAVMFDDIIQIFSGIEILALLLGVKLILESSKIKGLPKELYFIYKNIKFVEIV